MSLKIYGNLSPSVGKEEEYTIKEPFEGYNFLNDLIQPIDHKVKWCIYVLENGKWRKTKENDKTGETVSYTFTQKSLSRKGIKIEVQRGFETASEVIKPQRAEEQKILKVELLDSQENKPTKPFSYGQTVVAKATCTGLEYQMVNLTLWEDDAKGAGHSPINQKNRATTKTVEVKRGIAKTSFKLMPSFDKMAKAFQTAGGEGGTHEYYVTVTIHDLQGASNNVNVNALDEPAPPVKKKIPVIDPKKPKPNVPKPNAPTKPSVKKEITDVKLIKTSDTTLRVHVYYNGLQGKKIRFKLMEDDGGVLFNDLLINKVFDLPKNADCLYLDIDLKKVPKSKGDDILEGWEQELFVDIEVIETASHHKTGKIDVDITAFKTDPVDDTNKVVKVGETKGKKEKFEKVKEKGEEAVIYISSEIATAIEIDKNGKLLSYPDIGVFNGQEEYIEDGKIYCKKISSTKSAFPTYKGYIYRGNTKGEAIKKLKQDLKFKTHENAESTVLELARHSAKNNKNYGDRGPLPPNTIDKLYRLKYKKATNGDGNTSYRYRFVDDTTTNLPTQNDFKKEFESGTMTIGARSSISIDPWSGEYLVGCVGIRSKWGGYHSSFSALTKEQKKKYKNKYHCINNYLEGVIPELTGIYGRRGFSDEDDLKVLESTYDHETKVFVLVDSLPEINNCNCVKLKPQKRIDYYDSFGTKCIEYIDKKSTKNKFKGLYMVAQRRQENGFSIETIGNNPMNIKGKGDLGQISIDTHETINGKYVSVPGEKFANFSTEDKGFQGYLDLLDSNYSDAYKSLFDDTKTIDDFTSGLEDTGKNGPYATGKANAGLSGTDDYKAKVKELFNGVKKDYMKIYECKLCKEKDTEKKKNIKEDIELLKKLE